tara:strand:+ start:541 stop:1050 length:510 start_codon:yes stop_codon:yes gene_type:complete
MCRLKKTGGKKMNKKEKKLKGVSFYYEMCDGQYYPASYVKDGIEVKLNDETYTEKEIEDHMIELKDYYFGYVQDCFDCSVSDKNMKVVSVLAILDTELDEDGFPITIVRYEAKEMDKKEEKEENSFTETELADTETELAEWMEIQRQDRKNGNLDQQKIDKLDAIGFPW